MTKHNDQSRTWPLLDDDGGFVMKFVKILVLIITSAHLAIAGIIFYNHVTAPEILATSLQMSFAYQVSKGEHNYYPEDDLYRASNGYTPLAAQIFGWTIRFIGNDIRYVRMVSGLFGFGAIVLISLSVYRLTRRRFFAFAAAGLVAGMALQWFMSVGADTIHVAFAVLGIYLLIRDDKVGWLTALMATAAFFASFWSKQTGLAYLAVALGYITLRDWRKGLICSLLATVLGVAGISYFANLDGSNFIWLVFKSNAQQPLVWSRLWELMFIPLWCRRFGILLAFVVAGMLTLAVTSPRKLLAPQFLLLAVAFAVGNLTACKYGSGPSQAWFSFALLILVGVTFMAHFVAQKKCAELLVCAFLAIQSLMLVDDVRPVLINDDDKARQKIIMSILSTPGKQTYYLNNGYYNVLLGKKPYANVGHNCWERGVYDRNKYPRKWREFLETDPWDIVIIDIPLEDGSFVMYERLNKAYKPVMEIPPAPRFANEGSAWRWKKIVFERVKQRQ